LTARIYLAFSAALLVACSARGVPTEVPTEAGRHRAALASVTVANETSLLLEIAFRTAVPPVQEIVIGRVAPGSKVAMAPVPGGEPIIMIARRDDGAEYQSKIQSFPLDGVVLWSIPKSATFVVPAQSK
jgi:hypothetical protein